MRRLYSEGWLDMNNLATMDKDKLEVAPNCLVDDHLIWIGEEVLGSEPKLRASIDLLTKFSKSVEKPTPVCEKALLAF